MSAMPPPRTRRLRPPARLPHTWWAASSLRARAVAVSAVSLVLVSAAGVQAATTHRTAVTTQSAGLLSLGPLTEVVLDELRSAPLVVTPLDTPVTGPRRTLAPTRLRLSPGTLPASAAAAYLFASHTVHSVAPQCRVSPYLLAAVGRAASDHGRWAGRGRDRDARAHAVRDTDGGTLDGDRRADHGVGPMQMLPAMWAAAGVDADGDGRRDPRDLDDAALAAAVYLCAASRSGTGATRVDRALLSWSSDPAFPRQAHRLARAYAGPAFAPAWAAARTSPSYAGSVTPSAAAVGFPSAPGTVDSSTRPDSDVRHTSTSRPASGTGRPAGGDPVGPSPTGPTPGGPPTTPTPSPTPTPTDSGSPTPTPTPAPQPAPESHSLSGRLTWRDDVWSVGGTPVEAGTQAQQLREAAADHDRDGTIESNLDELTGLLDTNVVVEVDESGHLLMVGTDPYSG